MTKQAEKIQLKPLGDRVVAKRLEQQEIAKGGIILPDSAQKKQEKATVVAVGPGKLDNDGKTMPMPVSIGDVILLDKYAGQEITIDDEEYLIARADDIIACIEE